MHPSGGEIRVFKKGGKMWRELSGSDVFHMQAGHPDLLLQV